jgi:hypothetical protein
VTPSPGEVPSIFVKDVDGSPIPPAELGGMQICGEKGEITLRTYYITDKGNEFIGMMAR